VFIFLFLVSVRSFNQRNDSKGGTDFCQKVPFVLACFQASAVLRPETSDSDEKDALFGLDTQITIIL
jgi:hypothetical protein